MPTRIRAAENPQIPPEPRTHDKRPRINDKVRPFRRSWAYNRRANLEYRPIPREEFRSLVSAHAAREALPLRIPAN